MARKQYYYYFRINVPSQKRKGCWLSYRFNPVTGDVSPKGIFFNPRVADPSTGVVFNAQPHNDDRLTRIYSFVTADEHVVEGCEGCHVPYGVNSTPKKNAFYHRWINNPRNFI
jgi:hypothetical protein